MTTKKLAVAGLLIVGMMLASLPGFSQTEIILGGSTQGATFTGIGSPISVSLDLGSCNLGTCTLGGVAHGLGNYFPSRGLYAFTTPANLDLQLINSITGEWGTQPAGGFSYTARNGSNLLTGNLDLLSFTQVPHSIVGPTNTFYLSGGQITVTGGSLASVAGALDLTMRFVFPEPIFAITGSGGTGSSFTARAVSGTLVPTPEPATMVLLGSGMLMIGFVLRRSRRNGLNIGR